MAHRDEKPAGSRYGFPADAKGFLFPAVLWALYFVTIYSFQGTACALGWERRLTALNLDAIQIFLLGLTLLVVVVLLSVGIWSWQAYRSIIRRHPDAQADDGTRQSRFLAAGAALNAGLFTVASLWSGIPALWSQSCGGLS